MNRGTPVERKHLRSLSFPVDKEHLECFQAYLNSLGLAQNTQRATYRTMQLFGKSYTATSKSAFVTYALRLEPMESVIVAFKSAYYHYQRMCESGYQPGDRVDLLAARKPKSDFWSQFDLKPGHPARVLCKGVFDEKLLTRINFRQTAPDEWQFDGDEMRYRVTVAKDQCALTAHSIVTGICWMHRNYAINPDGTLDIR